MQLHNLHYILNLFPTSKPIPLYHHNYSHFKLIYTIHNNTIYPLKLYNLFTTISNPYTTFPYNTTLQKLP